MNRRQNNASIWSFVISEVCVIHGAKKEELL